MHITYSLAARDAIEKAGFGYHLPKDEREKLLNAVAPYSQEGFKERLKQELDDIELEKLLKMIEDALEYHKNENSEDVVVELRSKDGLK